jgi:hypothetical protein
MGGNQSSSLPSEYRDHLCPNQSTGCIERLNTLHDACRDCKDNYKDPECMLSRPSHVDNVSKSCIVYHAELDALEKKLKE